jgi:hypothetical protein
MADISTLMKASDGKMIKLKLVDLGDGTYAIKTETDIAIEVDSVTATNVTIKDAGLDGHNLVVEDDGSINVRLAEDDAGLTKLVGDITGTKTLADLETKIGSIINTDGIKKITDVVETRIVGTRIVEQKTQDDADESGVIEFEDNIVAVEIYHEEDTWQEFEINGLDIMIPPGGYKVTVGGVPSKEIVIPEIDCILWRLE